MTIKVMTVRLQVNVNSSVLTVTVNVFGVSCVAICMSVVFTSVIFMYIMRDFI